MTNKKALDLLNAAFAELVTLSLIPDNPYADEILATLDVMNKALNLLEGPKNLELRTPVKLPDGSVQNFTLKLEGKPYRCSCLCNVFHKPDDTNLSIYKCNACGTEFSCE